MNVASGSLLPYGRRVRHRPGMRKFRAIPGVKFLNGGSRTFVYGKNEPLRSWPISAKELEEVAMGSETKE